MASSFVDLTLTREPTRPAVKLSPPMTERAARVERAVVVGRDCEVASVR